MLECAIASRRMPCYETHRIRLACLNRPRKATPSHPVGFVPRRVVFCLYAAGIASLWSTGGRVHPEKGIVEFR